MTIVLSVDNNTYQRLVNTLRQLKNKNKTLESECESLKNELTTALQKRAVLQSKLQNLKETAVTNKSKDTENAMLLIKIKDLKEEHDDNLIKLNDLNKTLEKTVELLCAERKKRQTAESKTAKMIENIKNLSIVAQKLQGDPNQAKKNESLNQKIEEKRNRWKTTKRQLTEQLNALQEKRDQALESAHDSQVQIDLRVGLIEELNAKVEKRNQTISKLKNDIQIATDDFERIQNSLIEKRNEIDQLTEKEETLKRDITKAKTSLSNLKAKYEKECEKYSTAKNELNQLKEGVESKIEMMKIESAREISEKINPLEEECREKEQIIKQLKQNLEESKSKNEKAAAKLHELEAEREKEKKAFLQAKALYESKCQAMQIAIGSFSSASISPANS